MSGLKFVSDDCAQSIDDGRYVDLVALEVDQTVGLLVATAAEAHRDTAVVVAAAIAVLALGQCLDRLAFIQRRTVDHHQLALARRRRIVCFQCHRRNAL
jgi:hypothetical protein